VHEAVEKAEADVEKVAAGLVIEGVLVPDEAGNFGRAAGGGKN